MSGRPTNGGASNRPAVSASGVPLVRRRRPRPPLLQIACAVVAVRLGRLSVFAARHLPDGYCKIALFRLTSWAVKGLERLLGR